MAKVIKFPDPAPEKFGLQKVRRKKPSGDKKGQLDLFSKGKVVSLNQLSPFDEAILLDEQGNLNGAAERYQKAIEQEDCIADAYCNLGILEWQTGNFNKAIDRFTSALRYDPRHYQAHYNLANLYAEAGNYKLAKIHYGIAIELEPTFPNSYFNFGLTLALDKEYAEAIKMLRKYCSLTPGEDHRHVDQLIAQLSEAN